MAGGGAGSERLSSGAKPGCVRVFFALWPDAGVRGALAAAGSEAQAECGGRATASDKIHLTLFFVGDVERERITRLQALASSISAAPFELDLSTLGYWRHNRIVWAGSRRCPAQLVLLVELLRQNLAREGLEAEDRPYVPHVTLVRNAKRAPKKTAIVPLTWRASDFVLVESVRDESARYEVIARWPLVAPV